LAPPLLPENRRLNETRAPLLALEYCLLGLRPHRAEFSHSLASC
jgi:hypothetical protein